MICTQGQFHQRLPASPVPFLASEWLTLDRPTTLARQCEATGRRLFIRYRRMQHRLPPKLSAHKGQKNPMPKIPNLAKNNGISLFNGATSMSHRLPFSPFLSTHTDEIEVFVCLKPRLHMD
ncbi:hypothetical protein CLAIMM_08213 [Cladophialophora immunda]|nr:hypothetical protein CLAIMM_08213 [Cladophialophora immunda]